MKETQTPNKWSRRVLLVKAGRALVVGTGLGTPVLRSWAGQTPLRFIAPFSAGGDALARIFADALAVALARPIVVENAPGANTLIGLQKVARASGDGSTIGFVTDALPILQAYGNDMALEVARGLRPIARMTLGSLVLTVSAESGIRTLDALVSRARSAPERLNFGSPGTASPQYLAMMLLAHRLGIKLMHVPFGGTGPALNEMAAGRIDVGFASLGALRPLLATGRVVPIAVSGATRIPAIPDVPTINESKLLGFDLRAMQGLVGPASLAPEIARIIAKGVEQAMAATKARFEEVGYSPAVLAPQPFSAFLAEEVARYSKVVTEAELKF